jgi:hypothetical protein
VVTAAPLVTAAPIDAPNFQYDAQDDLGQYNYGYSNLNSVKQDMVVISRTFPNQVGRSLLTFISQQVTF